MAQLDVTDVRALLDASPYPKVDALRKYLLDTRLTINSIYWLLEKCCKAECGTPVDRRHLAHELYEHQLPVRDGLINTSTLGYSVKEE